MALLIGKKERIVTVSSTTITSSQTFCDLLTAMLAASENFATLISDLQTQINSTTDTKKVKIDSTDCEGYLGEKIISSDTVLVEVVTGADGCKQMKLNTAPPNISFPTGLIYEDVCKTDWTAITSYQTFVGVSGASSQVWQGNVEWSINKLGGIDIRGRIFINNMFVIMQSPTSSQAPQVASMKVWELPNIPCITNKIGNTTDYYGVNYMTYITVNQANAQSPLVFKLKRIGREFWIEMTTVKTSATGYGAGVVPLIEISFGGLKSIN